MLQSINVGYRSQGVIILEDKHELINVRVDQELLDQIDFIQTELSKKNLMDVNKSNAVRTAIRHLAEDLKK